MSDIPSEAFREILVRLPAVSLFRFRIVCKTWLQMIDDPSFIRAHAKNQVYSHTILVRNKTGAPIYFFSLDSLKFKREPQRIEATRIKQLIRPGVPRLTELSQVASCNGLVLLSHENIKMIWAIWNPLTGDCHELPQPNASLNKDRIRLGFGFGYDHDADDYKVVVIDRLCSVEKDVIHTLVYSLKSGSWSMIEGYPQHCLLLNLGAFLNGTLYWSSVDILALDLRTESYCELPKPQQVIGSNFRDMGVLHALDGCLIFTTFYQDQFDGWVMKDNGVEKSWAKLFSLSCLLFYNLWRLKLVAYLKSKRQVVLQHNGDFLWFDVDNNSVLKFSSHRLPYINPSLICSGSLVRLNARGSTGAVTATKTATRKQKITTKKSYRRLKLCVRNVEDDECSCFDDEDRVLDTSEED